MGRRDAVQFSHEEYQCIAQSFSDFAFRVCSSALKICYFNEQFGRLISGKRIDSISHLNGCRWQWGGTLVQSTERSTGNIGSEPSVEVANESKTRRLSLNNGVCKCCSHACETARNVLHFITVSVVPVIKHGVTISSWQHVRSQSRRERAASRPHRLP